MLIGRLELPVSSSNCSIHRVHVPSQNQALLVHVPWLLHNQPHHQSLTGLSHLQFARSSCRLVIVCPYKCCRHLCLSSRTRCHLPSGSPSSMLPAPPDLSTSRPRILGSSSPSVPFYRLSRALALSSLCGILRSCNGYKSQSFLVLVPGSYPLNKTVQAPEPSSKSPVKHTIATVHS
jgi:hypothetical protein